MFKKAVSLFFAVLCITLLAGCGEKQTTSQANSDKASEVQSTVSTESLISSTNSSENASSATSEISSNQTLSPVEATLLPDVYKAIRKDYLKWLQQNESGYDNLTYEDIRVNSCYGVYEKYQVVRCTAEGQTYSNSAVAVTAGKYTFKNTGSQKTLVHYDGKMIGLDEAYNSKVISDAELDEIYNNYPDELK